MPYDNEWLAICICLVLQVTCTLSNTDTKNNQVYDYGERLKAILPEEIPLLPEAANSFLQRRTLVTSKSKKLYSKVRTRYDKKNEKNSNEKKYNIISPLVDNTYGELKFTSYSAKDFVKKSDITTGLDVVAVKRTIKIGNQVCGSVKDANEYERRWKLKNNSNGTVSDVKDVHKCCWRHNKCSKSVPAKSTKYGFTNVIEYDIKACKCDSAFKKCLKDGKSYTADAIGHLYFDTLKIPCLTFSSHEIRREANYVSVVPDVEIDHPSIGAAQVAVKSNSEKSMTGENTAKQDISRVPQHAILDKKSITSPRIKQDSILKESGSARPHLRSAMTKHPAHTLPKNLYFEEPELDMSMF